MPSFSLTDQEMISLLLIFAITYYFSLKKS
jgi:hypothetical protein